MSDPHMGKPFPKGVLYGSAALILTTMALVVTAQLTGYGKQQLPEASAVQSVDVRFEDLKDKGLAVIHAASGREFARVEPGDDGFIRGVLRGMNRTRKLEGSSQKTPYRLTRWSDGRLSLEDLETGQHFQLVGFGQTNLQAFASLLAQAEEEDR